MKRLGMGNIIKMIINRKFNINLKPSFICESWVSVLKKPLSYLIKIDDILFKLIISLKTDYFSIILAF